MSSVENVENNQCGGNYRPCGFYAAEYVEEGVIKKFKSRQEELRQIKDKKEGKKIGENL